MHANCKALLCCMESLLGGVAAGVANDQDVVAEEVHSMADKHDVLIPIHELHSRQACLQQCFDLDAKGLPCPSASDDQVNTIKLRLPTELTPAERQCTWPSPVVPPTMTPSTLPSICRSTNRSYSRRSIFPFSRYGVFAAVIVTADCSLSKVDLRCACSSTGVKRTAALVWECVCRCRHGFACLCCCLSGS